MQIKISRSSRVCQLSGQEFVHDQEVVSLVRMAEGELIREDYAKDAWEADRADGAYSFWTTRYYDPQVADQQPEEVFSPLRSIFYEAIAKEERTEWATAFMAAQMLRRQKVFKQLKESSETDGEVRTILYTDRIGNRLIEVKDPSFTYAELQAGSTLLMQRLAALEIGEEDSETASPENDDVIDDAETTDTETAGVQDDQKAEPAMVAATETGESDGFDETEQ